MRRLADRLADHRWALFFLPVIFSALLFRSLNGGSKAGTIGGAFFGLAAMTMAGILVLNLGGRDPAATEGAASLDPDPLASALLARWLSRSRHFRFVGGLASFVLGFSLMNENYLLILLPTFAGIAAGGALAEVHSFTGKSSQIASADLIVRDIRNYVARRDTIAMVATAAIACVIAAIAVTSDSGLALLAATTALAVVGATRLMQRFVIIRPRPALPPDLRQADDLMRRLAATMGFTKPAIALSLGLLAHSGAWLKSGGVSETGALVLWIAAIVWYRSGRQNPSNLLAEARR